MRKQNCTYCEYRLCDGCWVNKVLGIIDEQPTAYDVEDKIKKLQQLAGNGHHDTLFDHKWELFLRANAVYRIVKGGGCDDEHTQEEFEYGIEPYCDDDGNNL